MWSFIEDDMNLLSTKAADESVSIVLRFNSFMAMSGSFDKSDLQHTVDFLEMCREKIDEAIDEKIEIMKARI